MAVAPVFCEPWPDLQLPGALLVGCRFDAGSTQGSGLPEPDFALPDEIQRSTRKRQLEFCAGRLCAREAMLRLSGMPLLPGLGSDRAPQWPDDFCGSISHSSGLAAALVARQPHWHSLGLDIEQLQTPSQAALMAASVMTPAELARLDPQHTALQFTLTFSLKESLYKALFPLVQRRFWFEDAELIEWDLQGHARMRLLTDLSADWRCGSELPARFTLANGQLLSLIAIA